MLKGACSLDSQQALETTTAEPEVAINRDPAFVRAFSEHQPALIRFLAQRLRCLFTARDLAQEVYLRAANTEDAQSLRNPRAYFFQVAANLATDDRRVENRRTELLLEVRNVLWNDSDPRSPERQLEGEEELRIMREVIRELPETSRRIFALNRFQGLTQREIAEQLGISGTAVEKHIRKVLLRLSAARAAMLDAKHPTKEGVG